MFTKLRLGATGQAQQATGCILDVQVHQRWDQLGPFGRQRRTQSSEKNLNFLLDSNGGNTLYCFYPMKKRINTARIIKTKRLTPMPLFLLALIAKGGVKTILRVEARRLS